VFRTRTTRVWGISTSGGIEETHTHHVSGEIEYWCKRPSGATLKRRDPAESLIYKEKVVQDFLLENTLMIV
jgi:hypothetical protein